MTVTPAPWTALPAPADLGHPEGTWLVVGPRTPDEGEPHTIAVVFPCDDGTHPGRAQADAQRITRLVNAASALWEQTKAEHDLNQPPLWMRGPRLAMRSDGTSHAVGPDPAAEWDRLTEMNTASLTDLVGLDPNFTGSLDAVDYIRQQYCDHQEDHMTQPTPQRFRKKPVVVEAMLWDGTPEGAIPIVDWVLGHEGATASWTEPYPAHPGGIKIHTLEGDMLASPGDWIIKGTRGEFYPCKPGPFADTFDAADPEAMREAASRLLTAANEAEAGR